MWISTFCNACGLACGHQGFFFINFVIFKISQNLYEENKKKFKVFPVFVKMKNIGAYNEFVQIMVTNYWIFFDILSLFIILITLKIILSYGCSHTNMYR